MDRRRPQDPIALDASHCPRRRTMLQGAAGLLLAWLAPVTAGAQDGRAARPAAGDWLVKTGDGSLTPLTPDDIPAAANPMMAWAMTPDSSVVKSGSRLNRILLVRLDPAGLVEQTRARAAGGVVAYSAICTHTGCEVGAYLADEQQLYCECHQSKFDPRDQARVTDGPAPRNLPALPLQIAEGRLVVAGPFTARPGFEQGDSPP
jgi:rieske iron-sulfur protein